MVKTIKINSLEEMKNNSFGFEFIPYMEFADKGIVTVIDVASLGNNGVYIRFTNYVKDEVSGKRTALNVEHQFVKDLCLVQNTVDYTVALMARNNDLDKLEATEVVLPRRKPDVKFDDEEETEEEVDHNITDDDIEEPIFPADFKSDEEDTTDDEEEDDNGVPVENDDVGSDAVISEEPVTMANKIHIGSDRIEESRKEASQGTGESNGIVQRASEKRDNALRTGNNQRNDFRGSSNNRRDSGKRWQEEGQKTKGWKRDKRQQREPNNGMVINNKFRSPGGMSAEALRQLFDNME